MTNLDLLEVFDMDDGRFGSRPPWSSLPSPPPPPILPGHASAWWCCVPPLVKRVSQDILLLATFPLFPFSQHSVILFGHQTRNLLFWVLANPRFRRSERSAFGIISRCKRSCLGSSRFPLVNPVQRVKIIIRLGGKRSPTKAPKAKREQTREGSRRGHGHDDRPQEETHTHIHT